MRIKKLIIKLGVILLLFESVACKNKNTELEKKIANLEKQNAELAKRQQEQQNLVSIKTNEIKKEKSNKKNGARGRSRTGTISLSTDFESVASTNFTTRA